MLLLSGSLCPSLRDWVQMRNHSKTLSGRRRDLISSLRLPVMILCFVCNLSRPCLCFQKISGIKGWLLFGVGLWMDNNLSISSGYPQVILSILAFSDCYFHYMDPYFWIWPKIPRRVKIGLLNAVLCFRHGLLLKGVQDFLGALLCGPKLRSQAWPNCNRILRMRQVIYRK